MSAQPADEAPQKSLPAWLPVAMIGTVIAFIVVVAINSSGSSTPPSSTEVSVTSTTADPDSPPTTADPNARPADEVQPVTITGTPLPPREKGSDAAVGLTAPDITGFGLDGNPVAFTNGVARAVVFLAHWCPHCQAEVDDLTAFLATHDWPTGVEIQTISTWVDTGRGNYPPSTWLDRVSWPFPVLADDDSFSAANALGLTGTPMWVFIDANGTVVDRTGGLSPSDLLDKVLALGG